jgi:hypothetical protein
MAPQGMNGSIGRGTARYVRTASAVGLGICLAWALASCSPRPAPVPTVSAPTPSVAPISKPELIETPTIMHSTPETTSSDAMPPLPAAGTFLHGVYPGGRTGEEDDITLEDLRAYEALAGKPAVWVYFSNNWYRSRRFPLETAEWIREAGSVPFIRLMLWSDPWSERAEPVFTLDRILAGEFDEDFTRWAEEARDFGTPIVVEFGTEVNGEWFPWNGAWNGAGRLDGYGAADQPDGPERFRDAYRHIVETMRAAGADNLVWVFHADCNDMPEEEWNRLEAYYPGDNLVDWLGVSVYGAQTPMEEEWPSFRECMDRAYPRLACLSDDKPILLLEFGVTRDNPLGDPSDWARDALDDILSGRWPRLIGFAWWNERWQNDDDLAHDTDMQLQGDPDLAQVFAERVGGNPSVLGRMPGWPAEPSHSK